MEQGPAWPLQAGRAAGHHRKPSVLSGSIVSPACLFCSGRGVVLARGTCQPQPAAGPGPSDPCALLGQRVGAARLPAVDERACYVACLLQSWPDAGLPCQVTCGSRKAGRQQLKVYCSDPAHSRCRSLPARRDGGLVLHFPDPFCPQLDLFTGEARNSAHGTCLCSKQQRLPCPTTMHKYLPTRHCPHAPDKLTLPNPCPVCLLYIPYAPLPCLQPFTSMFPRLALAHCSTPLHR